jgi:transposase-like protein
MLYIILVNSAILYIVPVNDGVSKMSKNEVQFQKGYSLPELFSEYGTDEQCAAALFEWKWPTGFECPKCGSSHDWHLKCRQVFQCRQCHHQTTLTSGTIFADTKLPLRIWFLAIHLITQSKTGLSALALKRQLGVSYNTAWKIKHKIMHVMKARDDSKPLAGIIPMDDVYWGGEQHGGKRGRGSDNKTPFVAAVALNDEGHPISMNMNVVEGFKLTEIERWATAHLSPGSQVISDGLACFSAVTKAGCLHQKMVTGGGPACVEIEAFQWVNTLIGNVKNSLRGAYHSISPRHLPRYLGEFCYRFNRRFELDKRLPRFMSVALRTQPMPYRLLKMAEDFG